MTFLKSGESKHRFRRKVKIEEIGPMLVLSRHRDESIIIGDDIVITIVDIRGDKVRIGIAAPIEIAVHRQEVYEAIQRENRQASRLEPQEARQNRAALPLRRHKRQPRRV
jgi:carbon storage regulator